MKEETFDVLGMTCAACQANVTKAVSKLDGVQSADVSLLSNSMKVEFDPEKVTPEQIMQAVDHIGYQAVEKASELKEGQPDSIQVEWENRQKRTREEIKERKNHLISSLVLLIVLLCFSMLPMIGVMSFLMDMKWMMVDAVIQLTLCLLILFIQRDFFTHGFKSLFRLAPNMDSLVAVGSSASFLYGMYGILKMAYGYGVMDHMIIHDSMNALYFEGAAMIVTLVSLGKFLEARSKAKTGDALGKLVDLAPKTATIVRDGVEIQVAANQVTSGDIVLIRPGQRIPVDGVVSSGMGYVDQAAITGESMPVEKQKGDEVLSATINVNGTFQFEATRVGSDTTLAQIIRLVDEAGNSKAPIARLADKVAGVFVPVVMGLGLLAFILWMIFAHNFGQALTAGISVLVISCPCALGLATPLAIMVSTGKAAEYGILIKSASALEALHSINTVVLDKTGTITSGKPEVVDIQVFDPNMNRVQFYTAAADIEMGSEHPLGKAIVEGARKQKLALSTPNTFEALGGRGLKATIGNDFWIAGNPALMMEENVPVNEAVSEALKKAADLGRTPLLFARNGKLVGMICVADTVRPTSKQALDLLHQKGIEVVMLTGDNERTAKAIAADLAIDRVVADVLPADKESVVRKLQEEGRKVVMVGDGINDAPALMRADVGIAIGAGTDIAIESADIVLMKNNLLDVVTAIDLSRATIRNVKENLFWAFFYNCLGIPVAMGALYPAFHILLNPMWGAAAMSLSSVCVCLNALRLRLFKPADETQVEVKEQEMSRQEFKEDEHHDEMEQTVINEQAENLEHDSLIIPVEGMSCAHCTGRVTKALEGVDGVVKADVTLDPAQAMVITNGHVTRETLEKAIVEAGYIVPGYPAASNGASESDKAEKTEKAQDKENAGQPAPVSQMILLPVKGMSCAHCVARVTKALEAIEGVEKADVTLDPSQAAVVTNGQVSRDTLAKAIADAGYQVHGYQDKADASGKPEEIVIPVAGMSCAHCTGRVTKALEAIKGVEKADVTLDPAQAKITLEPGASVDEKTLREAIVEAGYTPEDHPIVSDKQAGETKASAPVSWTIPVSGMRCAHCTGRVTKALEAVTGVQKAVVTLDPGHAVVSVDPDVDPKTLTDAIVEAGYQPGEPKKTFVKALLLK